MMSKVNGGRKDRNNWKVHVKKCRKHRKWRECKEKSGKRVSCDEA